ncbi:MAG TPA: CRISPR-associated protein Cas4 [Tepidimicrobium sp.]|nr:CRISPR-associated protein Cas4 [Tepidimicrobium sp.]
MSPLEQDYLALSGIQHFAFCPRQWALIHLEQQWEENIFTYKGKEFHQKANQPFVVEKRRNKIVSRAVPIVSHRLKLYGIADVVEFVKRDKGITLDGRSGLWWPTPVEYKVGKPKVDNWDKLQLCAQAVCLEEMFNLTLTEGQIYYGKTRRRLDVLLDAELRRQMKQTASEMHKVFMHKTTPKAEYSSMCDRCSLVRVCLPKMFVRPTVKEYLLEALEE